MTPADTRAFVIDARRCIRCGACATVAAGLFSIDGTTATLPPRALNDEERRACEAAVLLCPTLAIRRGEAER
jgi:ferredoxin